MKWGEIKDPIHGYIELSEAEREALDTGPMQRLRRIRQLGAAHLTYPGAEHSRFQHSLGVMHLSGLFGERLRALGLISVEEVSRLRLAGLLHDVGHGPFSHLFDELLERRGLSHEELGRRIIGETAVADALRDHGFHPGEISDLSVGRLGGGFLDQVVAGQFSADTLDYLVRDSYYTGVEYGRVDVRRLIDSVDVLGDVLSMDTTALYALEAFLIARYEMFKAVYFHRTVRAASLMLIRAMELADEALGLTDFNSLEEYLRLDDEAVMSLLLSLGGGGELETARRLASMVRGRRLLKCAYESFLHEEEAEALRLRGEERGELEAELAERAGADHRFLYVDVSTAPSVPYNPGSRRPEEIRLFTRRADGSRRAVDFSEVSPLASVLLGYINILRVYCRAEDLKRVRREAERFFAEPRSPRNPHRR
ncbi:MAG: HD superfamily phosphohydrolase [Candidatus Bathyarchaeota archaeon B23]|nr:MAG: HD superfamily phosphohydrolase [Candidatus Bathyarchaeota archaeon B23]